MAFIPDTPEVYEMLTVWEHLVFVARSCRLDADWSTHAQRLLDRLGIAGQRDTLGEALSKGMRQKLLIACSLIARTPVLLLDEPMIGLDPSGQRELKDILVEVRDQGAAIIVSSHLLEYMEPLCDQLLIIKEGRRVLGGPLSTLLGQRRQSLEEVFLEATT
jgi:ABC-2 type transport system ATP-binding protein